MLSPTNTSDEQAPDVAVSPLTRSRVTNGRKLTLFGDGRSAGARRYRDVLAALASELGGMDALPESSRQVVRRAAQTSVECELLESRRAAGEVVDPIAYATTVNANRRALQDLRALKRGPRRRKSLSEHVAENYGPARGAA